jgi:hypothetical protein
MVQRPCFDTRLDVILLTKVHCTNYFCSEQEKELNYAASSPPQKKMQQALTDDA